MKSTTDKSPQSKCLTIIPNGDNGFDIYATRDGLEELIFACMKAFNSSYMYEDKEFTNHNGMKFSVMVRQVGDLAEIGLHDSSAAYFLSHENDDRD